MASKYILISNLAKNTMSHMAKNEGNWKEFLNTASETYKYSFTEQVFIYAQRPDAKACASIRFWNQKPYYCWVKKGSKGIALIDEESTKPALKYVFDVSDVTPLKDIGKLPKLWEIQELHKKQVINDLEKLYGKTNLNKGFENSIIEIANRISKDCYIDIANDMEKVKDDSLLEELDPLNFNLHIRNTLAATISYMVLKRCNCDVNLIKKELDMQYIYEFNTPKTISCFAKSAMEFSKELLIEIGKTIKSYDMKDKLLENNTRPLYNALKRESEEADKINYGGNKDDNNRVSAGGGISDTKYSNGSSTRGGDNQIREHEERILEEPSQLVISGISNGGDIGGTFVTNSGTSRNENGINNEANVRSGERYGGIERQRTNGMGEEDEQYSKQSGRNSFEGDSIQLNLFPSITMQQDAIEIGARNEAPFLFNENENSAKYSYINPKSEEVPNEYIDNVLKRGSGFVGGKGRIETIYNQSLDKNERIKRLKKEYGLGSAGWPIDGYGLHGYDSFKSKGLHFQWKDEEGEKEGHVTWRRIDEKLSELIFYGRYNTDIKEENLQYEGIINQNIIDVEVEPQEPIEKGLEITVQQAEKTNYIISNNKLGEGTPKEKFNKNIEVIELLKVIEKENRFANSAEQEILAQYVGWGGLSNAFDKTNSSWKNEYVKLKEVLESDEYVSARESTLNSHYTSPEIIGAIYSALDNMGFSKGNVLEPAMGIGNFFGMMPTSMKDSRLYGVELDSISGEIAKQLYPNANIKIMGFEKTDFLNDFFDVAIGNVPFGQYKIADKNYDKYNFMVHDYFFAKTIDKVRSGGVIALITSKGTMDKQNLQTRKYIAQRTELLGAIRLPNTAFKNNAGTEVTADIIFLKKRDRIMDIEPDWVQLGETKDGIRINQYFIDNPQMILGQMKMASGPFGMEATCMPNGGISLHEQLKKAVSNISGAIETIDFNMQDDEGNKLNIIPANPEVKNYSYAVVEDEVYYRENSIMTRLNVSENAEYRIKGLIAIRNCAYDLIFYQLEEYSNSDIKKKQTELNDLYDGFCKIYGRLNSQSNKRAFNQDSSYNLLCSLEKLNDDGTFKEKADMFFKRTIKRREIITSADTANEGLVISLNEKARVDLDYISTLTKKTKEDIIKELKGIIFQNPITQEYETADEYLSGNVREKLLISKKYAETDVNYASNAKALEKVQNTPLEACEIEVRIGATWIDPKFIKDFMIDVFKTPENLVNREIIETKFSNINGQWNITGKFSDVSNPITSMTYGTTRANAYKILEDSLNLRDTRIFDTVVEDGKEKRVLNKKETILASQKQDGIRAEFKNWIFNSPERREVLCNKYNELFNSTRAREYNGEHLVFPGMNPEIELRPHQKNAIAHILYGNNTLLAHCVGAGKTYEMTAAAMESKRLGLCQKSLFVVPNHLTEQWASDFLKLYPGANILAATKKDFEPANRKKFCSRIATGDYDAVIIGHSQFEKIPLSDERQIEITKNQIEEITIEISDLKKTNGERYTVKQMEKTKKTLETRLAKLNDSSRKDNVVTFEQIGIDRLFVDESHNYKNLFLYTKMRNVAGISQTEAQKSSDMFAKCQYLDEITGGKGITFATGTPISNSMTELYTNMRYLQNATLQKLGLGHFDSWASSFGETITAIELAPEGTGYRAKTRFAKFYNLPELITLFKEVADIQTADMLKLPVPKVEYHNIALEPSEYQKEMIRGLADRAEVIRDRKIDPSEDNMLKVTNDGRKLALDQRLINQLLPDYEKSKANECVEETHNIYINTMKDKSTQLIFCDSSTPKGDGNFNIYDDIKNKLIAKGVPEDEVAFIHQANTELRKAELFAKVRSGQVRVLLGSTAKMGAGTNVQDKLIALHHLDVPWRPSDIEQQEGRILRQCNNNEKVEIFRYVTEGTFDSYSWQLIENKQKFIGQIMTSKSPVRSCEDIDDAALTYAEVKALATGNPYIKEKMDLDIQVAKLKLLKANHTTQKYRLEDNIVKHYPEQISITRAYIDGYKSDLKVFKANKIKDNDDFCMNIKGTVYQEKKDAGNALINACRMLKASSSMESLGEYQGFELKGRFDAYDQKYIVALKSNLSHATEIGIDPFGNITRLNNVLEAISDKLCKNEERLDNLYKQLENAEIEVTKQFPQEKELSEKTARLNELNALLNMEDKKGSGVALDEEKSYQEYNNMLPEEIEKMVVDYAESILKENGIENIKIIDAKIYGSRSKNVHKADSDIDVVIEYKGNIREDSFFNLLHEEEYLIGDMILDINPITQEKSGNIKDYIKRANDFLEEKISKKIFDIEKFKSKTKNELELKR